MSSTRLAALDFHDDIRRLTEDFTGRDWVFEEIDEWLHHHPDQRFFILTGEPGAGKSAIAARLTQIRPDHIAAYHFCSAGKGGTITPDTVLRSLAAQLSAALPQYGEALANTIKPEQLSVTVKQEINRVEAGGQVVGVNIDHLTAGNPEKVLDILFRAPLAALPAPETPSFILIDALDEAMTYSGHTNLITLLAKTNDWPAWVRFVCTTRPEQTALSYFKQFDPCCLATEAPQNLDDIGQYIAYRLRKQTMKAQLEGANVAPEDLAARLTGSNEGNFLYTKVLLDEIEQELLPPADLSTPPESLDEIYHHFLRRFVGQEWDKKYQPLLGALAVAREPLTAAQLAHFSGLGRRQVRRSLAVAGQYLERAGESRGTETYRLFHHSLRDYLLDEDRSDLFWCDPLEEHLKISDFYLENFQDDWSTCDRYGLLHAVTHLIEAATITAQVEVKQKLTTLTTNLDFLEMKTGAAGIYAVLDDLRSTLGILPPASERSREVQAVLHLLDSEAHHLQQGDENHLGSFFAQQLLYRAKVMNLPDRVDWATKRLEKLGRPYLALQWRGGRKSRALARTMVFGEVVTNAINMAVTGGSPYVICSSWVEGSTMWNWASGEKIRDLDGYILTITRDERYAIFGRSDGTLRVLDLMSGEAIHTLSGHTNEVTAAVVTRDARQLISASADGILKVWDLTTGKEIHTLRGHHKRVSSLAVTEDNLHVVSASFDKTLIVWDLAAGRQVRAFTGHEEWVERVRIVDGQQTVLSASYDGVLKVWDLLSGQEIHSLAGHNGPIYDLVVTSDGQSAVSACGDGSLKVWDLAAGQEIHTLVGHTAAVLSAALTGDDRTIISGSRDNTLKVWDLATGQERDTLVGHASWVIDEALSADDRTIISASRDNTLKVWDLRSLPEIAERDGHNQTVNAVALTTDNRYVASVSIDDTGKVWELSSGRLVRSLPYVSPSYGYTSPWHGADFTPLTVPGGERYFLFSYSRQHLIALDQVTWEQRYGSSRQADEAGGRVVTEAAQKTSFDKRAIWSVMESLRNWQEDSVLNHFDLNLEATILMSGGKHLVACFGSGVVRVLDTATGQELAEIFLESSPTCVDTAADRPIILLGDWAGNVYCLRYIEPTAW